MKKLCRNLLGLFSPTKFSVYSKSALAVTVQLDNRRPARFLLRQKEIAELNDWSAVYRMNLFRPSK